MVQVQGFVDVSTVLDRGIYALLYKGKVVYIGQAKSMLVRVYTHRNMAKKKAPPWMPAGAQGIQFDEVHVRPCHPDEIDDMEHALINFYKPYYNTKLKHFGNPRMKAPLVITAPNGTSITLGGRVAPSPYVERRI